MRCMICGQDIGDECIITNFVDAETTTIVIACSRDCWLTHVARTVAYAEGIGQ